MEQSRFEALVTEYQEHLSRFLANYPTQELQETANDYPFFHSCQVHPYEENKYILTDAQFAWICDNLPLYNAGFDARNHNYSLLQTQTTLKKLSICYCNLSDISWISALTELVELEIIHTNITNLNGLQYCKKITTLTLWNNKINNIDGISGCENLRQLDLLGNDISDIYPLSNLVHLSKLSIALRDLTWLEPLATLPNLQYLKILHCDVFSFDPLADCLALEELILSDTELYDYCDLPLIPNLKILDISDNCFTKLPPLSDKLKEIDFSNNKITDISALANLDNLRSVQLSKNPITSPPPPSLLKVISFNDWNFTYPYGQPNKAIPPNAQQIWALLMSNDPINRELAAQLMTALHWEQADADAYSRMAKKIKE